MFGGGVSLLRSCTGDSSFPAGHSRLARWVHRLQSGPLPSGWWEGFLIFRVVAGGLFPVRCWLEGVNRGVFWFVGVLC